MVHAHTVSFSTLALRALAIAAVGAGIAACGTDSPGGGVDGGQQQDGASQAPAGVRIRFATIPSAPGDVVGAADDLRLEEAEIRLENVRILGDAAAGDSRTFRGSVELRWDDEETDDSIVFADAPAGLYSLLVAEVDEYKVDGERDNGDEEKLEIDDSPPSTMSLSIPIDVRAEGGTGQAAEVEIEVDLGAVLAGVDWDAIPKVGETRTVTAGADPAVLSQVRSSLENAFGDSAADSAVQSTGP